MSAEKLSTVFSKVFNKNTETLIDDSLHIEWGHFHRSQAVEDHIRNISDKILARTKDATHLIVHLNVDLHSEKKGYDLIQINLELRFPKHQDLFCHSEGENLYEVLAQCKQQMLKMMNRRKRSRIKNRYRPKNILPNFEVLDF